MRIVIVYDCLYPHTVGGAERWYRGLAEHLKKRHQVTYLTRRQWDEAAGPETPFRVVAVSPGGPLYTRSGRRRIWPPLRFGLGVFWYLLRHGERNEVVHSASFPYFSLIGAWLAMRIRRRGRLVIDWFEVWSRDYWIAYLGHLGGRIGHAVQRLCVRLPDESFTFSRLHEQRLVGEGHRAPLTRLTGIYAEGSTVAEGLTDEALAERPPLVVFAGRHIQEKRVALVPDAIARARESEPSIRCRIYGDGPESDRVLDRIQALGLEGVVELSGRVSGEEVRSAIADAACLILPSLREGYGLVVVEATSRGTPAVVVDGTENAATELVEPSVNGYIARSADPGEIGELLAQAIRGGAALRRSTLEWYRAHSEELSIESSLAAIESAYAALAAGEPSASTPRD